MIEASSEVGPASQYSVNMNLFKPKLKLEVPADLMKVMHYYEDSCVMGCCGIDCLNLDVQRAVDGMLDFGVETAETALTQLKGMEDLVRGHHGMVLSDENGFGQHWDRGEDALLFLQQVRASLSMALEQVRRGSDRASTV